MARTTSDRAETILDEALAALHETDDEFDEPPFLGLSNHGPMAAEALVAMGHADDVAGFLAAYAPRLRPRGEGQPIPLAARHAALGDRSRGADWVATFAEMLEREPPAAVVARELPPLADGAVAAALHALIRTGHALRALGRRDTPVRRRELAHGLGYWASQHTRLPGRPGAHAVAGHDVTSLLRTLPRATGSTRTGLITDRIQAIVGLAGFEDAVEAVDLDAASFDATITALVDASARLYLSTPGGRFVYLHGITGSSMLRIIGPWLDAPGRRALLRGMVHALAALHATHADDGSRLDAPMPAVALDLATAARDAAESRDDHTIKLVEALRREHELAPRPVLLHVARHRLTT